VVQCGAMWFDVIHCGPMWYAVVCCGRMWYAMVHCGRMGYGVVCYGMMWHGVIHYGSLWYDLVPCLVVLSIDAAENATESLPGRFTYSFPSGWSNRWRRGTTGHCCKQKRNCETNCRLV